MPSLRVQRLLTSMPPLSKRQRQQQEAATKGAEARKEQALLLRELEDEQIKDLDNVNGNFFRKFQILECQRLFPTREYDEETDCALFNTDR